MIPGARRPRPQRQPAQPGELGRVRHLGDLAAHDHAPAGTRGLVGPVRLEADLAATAGGVELGSFFGAEHDRVPVQHEIDREHHRPAVVGHGHPAEPPARQQLEALQLGQLLDPAWPRLSRGRHGRRRWGTGRRPDRGAR